MKKTATMVLAAALLAATLSLVVTGSSPGEPVTAADVLPGHEILATVRAMGLDPIGKPLRRGPYYVLHAYDPMGAEVRVVADAQFGDILSVAPAGAFQKVYTPHYLRGPRIIHVPKFGEHRVSAYDREESVLPDGDDGAVRVPPAPHRRTRRPPQRHSKILPSPPPQKHRAILSAPAPRASGLTPLYPMPRFDAKPDKAEKLGTLKLPPAKADANSPPPGYTPPAALPPGD